MKKQSIFRLLIVFIIIMIIVLIGIVIKLISIKKEDPSILDNVTEMSEEQYEELFKEEGDYYDDSKINKTEYILVRDCIGKYLDTININNPAYYGYNDDEYGLVVSNKQISNMGYNLLSQDFISQRNIKKEDIFKTIKKLDKQFIFSNMEVIKLSNGNISSFAAHVLVQSMEDYTLIQELYVVIYIDQKNLTFSIEPVYNVNNISDLKNNLNKQEILKNDNNSFLFPVVKEEDIIKEYMNQYKRISLVYPDYIYNKLDEEYRNKRFESVEKFKSYINYKKDRIKNVNLTKYQKQINSDYIQYVCIDSKNNYYIFKEKSTGDYTIILDTYTIDLPEFKSKYEIADTKQKVSMNIAKIFSAIDDGDYKYVYNKLDKTFKENNFKTQQELENYLKSKIFTENKIEASDFQELNGVYTYKLNISDKTQKKQGQVIAEVIMKLLEGTDFVMSFSIK